MNDQAGRAEAAELSLSMSGSARNVVQAGNIFGGVHFHDTRMEPKLPVPRQLPADTAVFTGREYELARLLDLVVPQSDMTTSSTVVIYAIDGMAGIGKTALAVHVGHLLAKRFPDGQLFVDLHGYTPGIAPRDPGDVLASFLPAIGLMPEQIPSDLDARAALYRARLAGTKTLIVLDNAATEGQIRPLLPGAGDCLVLVTSRKRLKAIDEARVMSLDVLSSQDAIALFLEVTGRKDILVDQPLLHEIVMLCGHLPLALRIMAALLRHRPTWTLKHFVERVRGSRPGLAGFSDGDRNLTAVFDSSYHALTTAQQHAFRHLSLTPGPDIDVYAAAALLDATPAEAERLLQDLVDRNLLAEPFPGRYQTHDLIRIYAHGRAERDDPVTGREEALKRLLDYYQHTATRADRLLARYSPTHRPPVASPPRHVPALDTREQADAWTTSELVNLTAAIEYSSTLAQPTHAVALPATLQGYLRTHGSWTLAVTLNTVAARTADALGDPRGHATALTNLATALRLTGDYSGATDALQRALRLCVDTGDQQGQANALDNLGAVRWRVGDYPGATDAYQQALKRYDTLGDERGQASSLTGLGVVLDLTGDYPAATRAHQRALHLYRTLGDQRGQAAALTGLGIVSRKTGDYSTARHTLLEALALSSGLDDRQGQAIILANLGAVRREIGDYTTAAETLQQALDLFSELNYRKGHAHALENLGRVLRLTSDLPAAAAAAQQALEEYRQTGDRAGEAAALISSGQALTALGDLELAQARYGEALRLAREIGSPHEEAESLEGLGEVYLRQDRRALGAERLREALTIYQRHGMPGVGRVRIRLERME